MRYKWASENPYVRIFCSPGKNIGEWPTNTEQGIKYPHNYTRYRFRLIYIYICPECSTVLSVWCYKSFHTVEDLEGKKEDICNKILNKKAG